METGLSKQQEHILIYTQKKGGTCHSTAAYAALVDLGRPLKQSNEEILASVGSTLRSLVELGLMVKSGPGEYHLTEKGFRLAQSLADQDSLFLRH
jgi:Mn-dependent DtxR family transcriptional regulator